MVAKVDRLSSDAQDLGATAKPKGSKKLPSLSSFGQTGPDFASGEVLLIMLAGVAEMAIDFLKEPASRVARESEGKTLSGSSKTTAKQCQHHH